MLSPEKIDKIPQKLVEIYSDIEISILKDIIKRITKTEKISANWQEVKLKQIQENQKYILQLISNTTNNRNSALKTTFIQALEESIEEDAKNTKNPNIKGIKVAGNEQLQVNLLNMYYQTEGEFSNITRSILASSNRLLIYSLDKSYVEITTGVLTYQQSITNAIKFLSNNGLRVVTRGNYSEKVDSVVRRAVLTGVNKMACNASLITAKQLEFTLVETTAHIGARVTDKKEPANHESWQGKVYTLEEEFKRVTGFGTGEGLGGWNCRHSFHPLTEYDEPVYSKEKIKEMNERTVTYNGEEIPVYKATQMQRGMERTIKKYKRRSILESEVGIPKTESDLLVRKWQNKVKDFCLQTGLKRDYFREKVEF